jgi:hypothetical protein
MENNIQIVRLKDGRDVICNVFINDGMISMEEPMLFEVRNANLLIQHWLPIAVTKQNKITIQLDNVLCMIEPNNTFREYYEGLVSKINDVVEGNDLANADANKIREIIDALEESPEDTSSLH